MTIRTKITILFSSIVALLLILFCFIIYFLSEVYRKTEFKTRLRQEALSAATILFNGEEASIDLLKLITRNQMTALNKEDVVLLNANNKVIFKSGLSKHYISIENINNIRTHKEKFWNVNNIERFGMVFSNKNQEYVIITSAIDKYGLSKQKNLAILLSSGSILLIIISAALGSFFARGLLNPMKQMVKKIDNITASNLNLRLHLKNEKDELGQLSVRFNEMLDRLQKAFTLQKSFVSHASHELRTPLTAITGQIQVSLLANDNEHELRLMAKSVLEDVNQLNILTNNLLDLTSLDTEEKNIKFTLLNVLEELWQVRLGLLKKYPDANIIISIDGDEEFIPEVHANKSLIHIVLTNLFENGIKFSKDQTIRTTLKVSNNFVQIKFLNNTEPISNEALINIFEPFTRGANARKIKGHGVGLSLTKRIIKLHSGYLNAQLIGTDRIEFTLKFNKIFTSTAAI